MDGLHRHRVPPRLDRGHRRHPRIRARRHPVRRGRDQRAPGLLCPPRRRRSRRSRRRLGPRQRGRLDGTLNQRLLDEGMAYYTVYSSTPGTHRRHLRSVARHARDAGAGVWALDATAEFVLDDQTSIDPTGQLILPKLFRRATDFLKAATGGSSATSVTGSWPTRPRPATRTTASCSPAGPSCVCRTCWSSATTGSCSRPTSWTSSSSRSSRQRRRPPVARPRPAPTLSTLPRPASAWRPTRRDRRRSAPPPDRPRRGGGPGPTGAPRRRCWRRSPRRLPSTQP